MRELEGAPTRPAGPTEAFHRKSTFYPKGESSLPKRKSRMPMWVGGLLFIVAFFDFGGILVASLYVSHFAPELSQSLALGSAILGGSAVFTMMGAALAFLRKMWKVCLVAALTTLIIHILGYSPVSVLLTMGAVAGLLMCKQEFE